MTKRELTVWATGLVAIGIAAVTMPVLTIGLVLAWFVLQCAAASGE